MQRRSAVVVSVNVPLCRRISAVGLGGGGGVNEALLVARDWISESEGEGSNE
jgi:hypothetical protein